MMDKLTSLLHALDDMVRDYLAAVADPHVPARVRSHDLRHMAFWHGYYADTVSTLAAGESPAVLRGTYKVINRRAQQMHADLEDARLHAMIEAAHARLLKKIPQLPADRRVPYKKGSRDYLRDAYVDTVSAHFDMHIRYLRKIAAGAPESFYVFHD